MLSTVCNSLILVGAALVLFWALLSTPAGQVEDAIEARPQGSDLQAMADERMRRRQQRRQAMMQRRAAAALAQLGR